MQSQLLFLLLLSLVQAQISFEPSSGTTRNFDSFGFQTPQLPAPNGRKLPEHLDPDDSFEEEDLEPTHPGRGNGPPSGRGRGRGNGNGNQNKRRNPGQGRGKKKGHSRCGPNGKFCSRTNYIPDIGLNWSERVQNGTGFFARSDQGRRIYFPIGIREPNERFGNCVSPTGENGYCRHLEYCILDDFRRNFVRFLEYFCTIPYGGYAGVCCPESFDYDDGFLPTLPPSVTRGPSVSVPTYKPTQPPITFPPDTGTSGNGRIRCGYSEQKASRIVGGRIADPKAWHWMAALIRSKPDAGDVRVGQFCGGVLISEFYILTAAHCVDQFQVKDIKVRLGEYDFSNTRLKTNPHDFDILSITVHEKFNRYTYENDIALVRLARSAFVNNKIRPICLPPPSDDRSYENQIGIVTGWGTIYYGGPTSNTLMEVSVPIWKQEDCKAAYTQPIQNTNLCAGVRSGSRDSCQGDSGGPLQLQGGDLSWRVVGIVSWGIRCAEPGYPGVYTRVSKYLSWIDTHS